MGLAFWPIPLSGCLQPHCCHTHCTRTGVMPVLVVTQPINSLAFVWDGALFAVGGFRWVGLGFKVFTAPSSGTTSTMWLVNVVAKSPQQGLPSLHDE
jgi:hypothetical protein